jgi:hypothetical protein
MVLFIFVMIGNTKDNWNTVSLKHILVTSKHFSLPGKNHDQFYDDLCRQCDPICVPYKDWHRSASRLLA